MSRAAAFLALVVVLGCGPREAAQVPQAERGGVVVVYSPHGPDVLGDYEARFEGAYPGVDVQWFDMGSNDVFTKVEAERNRPRADIWWGAPSTLFVRAAERGLLEPYRPSWAERPHRVLHDAQDRWYGVYLSPLAIVFNTHGLTENTAPQTWDELLDPKWDHKIALRKPLASGTMRTFIDAMIVRAPNEDAGIAWLKRLHDATEAYMDNPQFLFEHLKRNPGLVSIWLAPDIAMQRERNGYPFDCVIPPQTPVVTEAIAIIHGAPHPDWAKAFYEFVTSPEELAHQAKAYWKVPARQDLDPATLPKWIEQQRVDAMPVDWGRFAEKEDAWCTRWNREVFGASGTKFR